MKFRVATVGLWSVSWAVLGWWLFDPESHINRGPSFILDNRRAESACTAMTLGALVGGLGGIIATIAIRSNPWRVWVVAIFVGALSAGGAEGIHQSRYPIYDGPPWNPPQPVWKGSVYGILSGSLVAIPVGLILMGFGEIVTRRERKACSVSESSTNDRTEPDATPDSAYR
jgi:hypothetical protein